MADDPKILDNIQSLNNTSDALKAAGVSGTTLSNILETVAQKLGLTAEIGKAAAESIKEVSTQNMLAANATKVLGESSDATLSVFDRLKTMTTQQSNAFNLLSTSLLGASTLLKDIGSNNAMASFSEQIKAIVSDAGSLTAPMAALAKSLGIDISKSFSGPGFAELKAKIIGIGAAIDQHMNMQRAVFNMAASTGQMGTFADSMGASLSNLGNITKDYEQKLNAVSMATHTSLTEGKEYFESLNKLPPATDASTDSSFRMSQQMDQLQQSITLAHGAGQTFGAALENRTKLLETFNVTGDAANMITARGAELTENFGVNIGETTGFLTTMADSFKMLGDNTEGMSAIFNDLFQGLRDGGMGIQPAIKTIEGVGEAIAHMTIAQRAFLSAKTGGPGGLLGGLEIERDLAAGGKKAEDVFKKIQQAFTQSVGGKVITRDEAIQTGNVAQYEKQVRMAQNGPFGKLAQSDEGAAALFTAFNETGKGTKTATEALSSVMKQGTDYQKLSYTRMDDIAKSVDAIKMQGGAAFSDVAQNAFTERGATAAEKAYMADAMDQALSIIKEPGGKGEDRAGAISRETITGLGRELTFGPMVEGLSNSLQKNLGFGSKDSAKVAPEETDYTKLQNDLAAAKKEMQTGAGLNSKDVNMAKIRADEAMIKKYDLGPNHQNIVKPVGSRAGIGGAAGGEKSDPTSLHAVINVFVDGKKVQMDHAQVDVRKSYGQPPI